MRFVLILILAAAQCFGAYSYRKKITVASGKVSADQAGFTRPVHVLFETPAHVTHASAYDVAFYSNSNCTSGKLNWMPISWNSGTGHYWAYVQQDLASGSDNEIWICYGDSGISTPQYSTAPIDANTVFYLPLDDPDDRLEDLQDLAGHADINKAVYGSWYYYPVTATGKINKSFLFDDTWYGHVLIPDTTVGTSITVSQWVKTDDTDGAIVANGSDYYRDGFALQLNSSGHLIYRGAGYNWYECSTSINDNVNWHHVVVTQTSTTVHVYVDGSDCSLTGQISAATDPTRALSLGAIRGDSDGSGVFYRLGGNIDEFWMSTVARSASWTAAVYASQEAPDTFQSVASEEAAGGGGGSGRIRHQVIQ